MSDSTSPRLPPELICYIFQIAASQYLAPDALLPTPWAGKPLSDILNMELVCKDVRFWVREQLYRVVWQFRTAKDRRLFVPPSRVPLATVGPEIKRLLVNYDSRHHADTILQLCPNVTDLSIWGPIKRGTFTLIEALPLTRLSLDFGYLDPAFFAKPFMHRLTRLDILRLPREWSDCYVIAELQGLTHLSLNIVQRTKIDTNLVVRILEKCPQLVVLIGLMVFKPECSSFDALLTITDHRLVPISAYSFGTGVVDWREDVAGRFGLWGFAEHVSEARLYGFFRDGRQRWFQRSMNWTAELNDRGLVWYNSLPVRDWMTETT